MKLPEDLEDRVVQLHESAGGPIAKLSYPGVYQVVLEAYMRGFQDGLEAEDLENE